MCQRSQKWTEMYMANVSTNVLLALAQVPCFEFSILTNFSVRKG